MTWFVARNPDTSIASLNRSHMAGYNDEQLADNDPAVVAFQTPSAAAAALAQLQANDAFMFRALEVLIDILIAKGTIVATDVTPAIRTLYQNRKALRVTAGVP